jgi:hypothetical protein
VGRVYRKAWGLSTCAGFRHTGSPVVKAGEFSLPHQRFMCQAFQSGGCEGSDDNSLYTQEPDECESLTSGSVVGAGSAMAPPTITRWL